MREGEKTIDEGEHEVLVQEVERSVREKKLIENEKLLENVNIEQVNETVADFLLLLNNLNSMEEKRKANPKDRESDIGQSDTRKSLAIYIRDHDQGINQVLKIYLAQKNFILASLDDKEAAMRIARVAEYVLEGKK